MVTVTLAENGTRMKKRGPRQRGRQKRPPCGVCAHRNKSIMFPRPESRREGFIRLSIPIIGNIRPAKENELEEPGSMVHSSRERYMKRQRQSIIHQFKHEGDLDRGASVRILSSLSNREDELKNCQIVIDYSNDPWMNYEQQRNDVRIAKQPFETKYAPHLFDPLKVSPFNNAQLNKAKRLNAQQRRFDNHEVMAKLDAVEKLFEIAKSVRYNPDQPRYPPLIPRPVLAKPMPSLAGSRDEKQSSRGTLKSSSTPPNTPGKPLSARQASNTTSTSKSPVLGEFPSKLDEEDEDELFNEATQPPSPLIPEDIEKSVEQHLANLPIWGNNNNRVSRMNSNISQLMNNIENDDDDAEIVNITKSPYPKSHNASGTSHSNKSKHGSAGFQAPKVATTKVNRSQGVTKYVTKAGETRSISASAFDRRAERQDKRGQVTKTVTPGLGNLYYPREVFWEFDPYTKSPVFLHNLVDAVETPPPVTKVRNRKSAGKSGKHSTLLSAASGESVGGVRYYDDNTLELYDKLKRRIKERAYREAHHLPPIRSNTPVNKGVPLYRSFHEPPGR